MKLQSKITIATVGLSILSTFSVGGMVLTLSYNNGIKQIQNELTSTIRIVEDGQGDAISTALLAVNGHEMTLGFVETDGNTTLLQDAAGPLSKPNLQTKTMNLADGEKLIFAASADNVVNATVNSFVLALILAALASTLASVVSWLILKSDLRNIKDLIAKAGRLAAGEKVSLEKVSGSREIVILSNSLAQMVAKLQDLNSQMQEFLGDASHELKTPLTVIRGYLEILRDSKVSDPQQISKAIDRAHKESIRMQEIISDILLLAELGEKRDPVRSPINFEGLFEEAFVELQAHQQERPIVINSNQHSDFIGSPELLNRFMQNVISNILKYTPANAEVNLNIVQTPVGFEVIVDDAGPGIPNIMPNQTITAFTRFDESRSRNAGGTGLGLSIMAKIIENHGGSLQLTKSSLGGLRVSAFLPN